MAKRATEKAVNAKISLVCPICRNKAIYYRRDGSRRCGKCGYDENKDVNSK